jgi:hypothetical protein
MKCSPISIRLTPAIRARLEYRAQGRSLAEVIRADLVRYWDLLAREKKSVESHFPIDSLPTIIAAFAAADVKDCYCNAPRMAFLLREAVENLQSTQNWTPERRQVFADIFMRSGEWLALADMVEQYRE